MSLDLHKIDLHQIALAVIVTASVLSLLLLVAKALAKEFEEAAVVWIRALKRIRAELRAPVAMEPSGSAVRDQTQRIHVQEQTRSKPEFEELKLVLPRRGRGN